MVRGSKIIGNSKRVNNNKVQQQQQNSQQKKGGKVAGTIEPHSPATEKFTAKHQQEKLTVPASRAKAKAAAIMENTRDSGLIIFRISSAGKTNLSPST